MSEGTRTDEKSPADPDRVARDAHEQIEVELAQKDSSLPAEQRLVLEALGHLPADLRDVFLLHHLDGLTCEQIAQRRSLTSAHVKVLL
ncbi:MAG: RNA polymerase sigma factor, partial [Pirellulales bacterium]